MSTKIVAVLVCVLSVGRVCADSFKEELDRKSEQLSEFRENVLNKKAKSSCDASDPCYNVFDVKKGCGCGSTSSCTS